jgi:FixJ family two-component response regulator
MRNRVIVRSPAESLCLDITPRAVELRRASLMKKLGVRSLVELLRLMIAQEVTSESRKDAR